MVALVAQVLKNLSATWEIWVQCLGWEDPLGWEDLLQHSGLESSMDCIVLGVAKTRTQLSDFHFHVCVCMELNHSAVDLKHCKSTTLEAHSCLFLCDPMECSLPGSSVHGILQARVLEWVAIPFSGGSS